MDNKEQDLEFLEYIENLMNGNSVNTSRFLKRKTWNRICKFNKNRIHKDQRE